MKTKFYSTQLLALIFLLVFNLVSQAQVPSSYLCTIQNDSLVSSTIYEFDIFLLNTDPVNTFEIDLFQAGILVNPSIVNGGTITASIIAGSSQLVAAQQPASITFSTAQNCIKVGPGGVIPHGSATIISTTSPGTRVARIRLTNSVAFGQFAPNFSFNFTASPYNTGVIVYNQTSPFLGVNITNSTNHSLAAMINPVLNAPVALYIMTGGGTDCTGTGVAVGLSGSEVGVQYRLLKNAVPVGTYIPGIGSALAFGSQTSGTYTSTAYRKGTYLTANMSGNAAVTQGSVTPSMLGSNSVCVGSNNVVYTTDVGQTNYVWTISAGGIITGGGTPTSNTATVAWNTNGNQSISVTYTPAVGCATVTSYAVAVNNLPTVPLLGTIIQPNCTIATGSAILNGLPSGNWTLNPGAISGSGSSYTFPALIIGTYNYTVTNASGCISPASANVVINSQPTTPAAPLIGTITQPNCTIATGIAILNGLPSGNWTLNPGAISGSGSSYTFPSLATGTYNYTVTNASGCISPASANIVINSQPTTPAAPLVGTITQPNCTMATGIAILNGLPSGNWTLNPGAISGSGSSYAFPALATGTYNYIVTNASGCISPASANVVINSQPATPVAPLVGTITQPNCTMATGIAILNGLPSGNWTLYPGAISGSGSSYTFPSLATGTYNYTVTNASGCISLASANVVINSQPTTPAAPLIGTITQPNCTIATGIAILNGLPSGNWTLYPGAISGSGSSYTFPSLATGTYNYTVTNASGCISPASANVVINSQPTTPAAPLIGTITQPNCTIATGIAILNGLPSGNWTLNPGAISGSGSSYTFPSLATGTYNYSVTNSDGCISGASANVVIDPQPALPIVSLGSDVTICIGQSVLLDAGNPGSTYLWKPGGQTTQTKFVDSIGLGIGAHTISVLVTAANTCSDSGSIVVTFDPCTGIAENNDGISFGIDPNPSIGMFYLTVKSLTENATFDIFDMSGQIIYTEQIDKTGVMNKAIDLTSYPEGMYFARLVSDKHSYMEKIIIN